MEVHPASVSHLDEVALTVQETTKGPAEKTNHASIASFGYKTWSVISSNSTNN
jgi:hypothetical protein